MVTKASKNINFSGEDDELYPEVEMMIEQKAYESFLFAAEYGSDGVKHLIDVIENLKKRMEDYGSY